MLVFGPRGLSAHAREGFRVHIEAPWLETLLGWLDGAWGDARRPSTRAPRGAKSRTACGRGETGAAETAEEPIDIELPKSLKATRRGA